MNDIAKKREDFSNNFDIKYDPHLLAYFFYVEFKLSFCSCEIIMSFQIGEFSGKIGVNIKFVVQTEIKYVSNWRYIRNKHQD